MPVRAVDVNSPSGQAGGRVLLGAGRSFRHRFPFVTRRRAPGDFSKASAAQPAGQPRAGPAPPAGFCQSIGRPEYPAGPRSLAARPVTASPIADPSPGRNAAARPNWSRNPAGTKASAPCATRQIAGPGVSHHRRGSAPVARRTGGSQSLFVNQLMPHDAERSKGKTTHHEAHFFASVSPNFRGGSGGGAGKPGAGLRDFGTAAANPVRRGRREPPSLPLCGSGGHRRERLDPASLGRTRSRNHCRGPGWRTSDNLRRLVQEVLRRRGNKAAALCPVCVTLTKRRLEKLD